MPTYLGTGLDPAEARRRLERDGFNELPAAARPSLLSIAIGILREPMFALLLAGALIYVALGDAGDALLLLGFATLSVSIAIVQQERSERAMAALRDLASPRARVVRDGR